MLLRKWLANSHQESATIEIKKITDWDSFHSVFVGAMGFPGFSGRNMDAC
jgi:RNAse (barnase) inhibitor barstar